MEKQQNWRKLMEREGPEMHSNTLNGEHSNYSNWIIGMVVVAVIFVLLFFFSFSFSNRSAILRLCIYERRRLKGQDFIVDV